MKNPHKQSKKSMIFGQHYNIKLIISYLNRDSYDKVDKQALKILRLEKQLQMVQKDIMQKDYAGKVRDLTDELGQMKEKLRKYEELFTPGQRKRIVTGKATHWTEEDKSVAMATYCAGPKAYKLMRKRGIPLPAPRTLKKYAESVKLQPGFLEPVLDVLTKNAENGIGKYFTLSWDEMKVKQCYEYDHSRKRVLRPVDQVLVMMVKGLCSNWQQVVYYNFDKTPTKELIASVLDKLEGIGLIPVATVCDLGTKNLGTFKQLGVSVAKPFFLSPNGNKVFAFADTPHLLKLMRNHFLDTGFTSHGELISARPVAKLLDVQRSDIGIAYRLTPEHFPTKRSTKRQKVKFAAQVFSNSVSAALLRLDATEPGVMPPETKRTAEFIKLINDWFDIFNTRCPVNDSRPTQKAFGYPGAMTKQWDILTKVYNTVLEMRAVGKSGLIQFQKGILMNIKSLLMLYQHLRAHSEKAVKYIMTDRLNQDCLERFFGYMRSKGGGLNDHPSPLQFKYRLRASIVGMYNNLIPQIVCYLIKYLLLR